MKKYLKYMGWIILLIAFSTIFEGCTTHRYPRRYPKPRKNCNCPSFSQHLQFPVKPLTLFS
ncbi:MAG: hypothetical protein D4R67_13410 [Bacteroidetes bacterium]|nr:MAG: hypothetical protein D4R67_13410 [Bacteroidota bacterium]